MSDTVTKQNVLGGIEIENISDRYYNFMPRVKKVLLLILFYALLSYKHLVFPYIQTALTPNMRLNEAKFQDSSERAE